MKEQTMAIAALLSTRKALAWAIAALTLVSCGGGGEADGAGAQPGATPSVSLTPVQQAIQDSLRASEGGSHAFYAFLPPVGSPFPGAHHAISSRYTAAAPLSSVPQKLTVTNESLFRGLSLPDFNRWSATEVLRRGSFVTPSTVPHVIDDRVRLHDGVVVTENYAIDGTTLASAIRTINIEKIPLSGSFALASPEVRMRSPINLLSSNSSLLRESPSFLPGSAYFRYTVVRHGDVVFPAGCNSTSLTIGSTAGCGSGPAVEGAFPQTLEGLTFLLSDGVITNVEGLRSWVSNEPLPTSVTPTASHLVLFELGGQVHRGVLQRDGTPIRIRLADGSISDYLWRFN